MVKIGTVLALALLIVGTLVGCGTSAPQARFSATHATGYAPLEVQFTDSSTGNIDAWQWDFDNNGTMDSAEQNPQYIYDAVGNYTVSLTVIGPDGNNTVTKTEFVRVVPCPRFADFIAEPTVGVGTTTVQFTDLSTGNVTGWAWDFESDGIIDSTEQNTAYTYTKNGVYSVTLSITTAICDDAITKWDYITISGCHT